MAIIVRIDVDRPYGRVPVVRHVLSRFSSDFYLPRIEAFGYLTELKQMLDILDEAGAQAHVFFRRCTLPSASLRKQLARGRHEIGLHLENSRTFETYADEHRRLENDLGVKIVSFSKHGSGGGKFGRLHHAPYEPERYLEWAPQTGMRVFFGNLEDPTMPARTVNQDFRWYPSAFWLEPHWRDTSAFTVEWLLTAAKETDIVLLVHPENVLADPSLIQDFTRLVSAIPTKIIK